MLLSSSASAQDGAAQLNQIGQRFVDAALHQPAADAPQGSNGMPLRMEVDGSARSPPAAGRLRQGRALSSSRQPSLGPHRLGLRCVEGSVPWNVFLPSPYVPTARLGLHKEISPQARY